MPAHDAYYYRHAGFGKNKRFAKWLMKNRAELSRNDYNVDVIKASFRTGRPLAELQNIRKNQQALKKAVGISELRTFFKNSLHISQHKKQAFIPTTIISERAIISA